MRVLSKVVPEPLALALPWPALQLEADAGLLADADGDTGAYVVRSAAV